MSHLDSYLERIGYSGSVGPDARTLCDIHRAHIMAIPYENLEIQLGRENRLSEDAFHAKLVAGRRGGWCYEMNGLLTRSLREIGFRVTRVAGAVAREFRGDASVGNHLVGLVDLDRRYVADVGLGDGPLEPFPLEERSWSEGTLTFRLERLDDAWWRFHNHEHGMARSFDFTEEPRELSWYQGMCSALQTDEASVFVQYAIASRRSESGAQALRDATYLQVVDGALTRRELTDGSEYASLLARILGADLGDDADRLWQRVAPRAAKRAENAPD
jgi:N-hydroxyarylamine O-acetyltransferase